jgi:Protein of unknown function (DUF2490)
VSRRVATSRRARLPVLLACLLAQWPHGRAAAEHEAQLWLELELRHRLSRRWELSFEQHLRFDERLRRLAQVMPDLSASYRARSFLRAIAGYRLQYERDGSGDFELRHRLYAGGQLQRDLGPLRLSLRALFTEQLRPEDSGDDATRAGLRTRGGVTWRGPERWKVTSTAELFFDLEAPEATKLRLGLDLQPGLRHLELGYRLELPRDDAPVEHALVLSGAFEL